MLSGSSQMVGKPEVIQKRASGKCVELLPYPEPQIAINRVMPALAGSFLRFSGTTYC
jgi:hypothetical protein